MRVHRGVSYTSKNKNIEILSYHPSNTRVAGDLMRSLININVILEMDFDNIKNERKFHRSSYIMFMPEHK